MEIVGGHAALTRPLWNPAVALGNFDGVHRGHLRLFEETRRLAAGLGGEAVVLTFSPHPAKVLNPRYAPPLITTPARKLELIAQAQIDVCIVEPFNAALAALDPEAFVDRILVEALGARAVVVGYDFSFGRARAGNPERLAALAKTRGFEVTVIEPVAVDGIVCSSTRVREFVLEGRVEGAALLLGRDFELSGEVVRGAGRGRTIGVPTANVRPDNELLPKGGVYAGWAELPSGERWTAAINVGTNPTFNAGDIGTSPLTIEAHLLDFSGPDLYGTPIRLGFSARLREERRFPTVSALVEQIRKDIEAARASARATRQGGPGTTEAA